MSNFISAVRAFVADENGVTALEYGMIAALIAVAIATIVKTLGGTLSGTFETINTKMVGTAATPAAA